MTFKQIREKLKTTQNKLDVVNLALLQERNFYSSMLAINEFNEKRINDLTLELKRQYDAKTHIVSNVKKIKEERDLYYGRWIDEIGKKHDKFFITGIFLFLLGLGVGIVLGLGVK